MRQPWRRIGAYGVDYLIMLIWMAVLFGLASAVLLQLSEPDRWTNGARWALQAQAFAVLTVPVWLYFTLFEAFGGKATIGKRITGLRVQGSASRIALRNALKFAPWEIAHTGIWHGMPEPFGSEPTGLGWVLFALSLILSALYVMGLFTGSGQPLYDRLAGTQVRQAD